jgi:hypothetical protein
MLTIPLMRQNMSTNRQNPSEADFIEQHISGRYISEGVMKEYLESRWKDPAIAKRIKTKVCYLTLKPSVLLKSSH